MEFLQIIDGEDKSSQLKNRIRKNYRHLRKWAKRSQTNCFRVYDREIKEYPLAIDYYDGRFCVHYFSYSRESDAPSVELEEETNNILSSLFSVEPSSIYWRFRIRRKKTQQYEKVDRVQEFFEVVEHGVKFRINLVDYLDTGLFLDHRETRRIVASVAKGKRLLNLFAYTSSFSVHAAMAGASFTKSVDMSNTYCSWGKENFTLNGLSTQENLIVRADCLKFLTDEAKSGNKYDVIVIDPPTISRSKKMDQMFDVQKDYIFLLTKALELLTPDGVIYFSTNSRKFNFDLNHFQSCKIEEISHKTLPIDFHNPKIHRCWRIRIAH